MDGELEGFTVYGIVDESGEVVLDCDRCGDQVLGPGQAPSLLDIVRAARAHTSRCLG